MSNRIPFKHYAIVTAKVVGWSFLLAALVHISWNMFAPDMFGLEPIRMKQALGLVLFAATFSFLIKRGGHRNAHSASA
ncbi:MAG: hypothetical protein HN578_11440 [Rhodospirillales bacterium]|jgi:hypothetical protein|nr:hypothetical protein [Rhodospirillales bacterium]MBT3905249.1 hypothetical protein [Rhodospirillaceae bacterium]MBT5035874.1 hypothetical protein [Rhodospirillaceae bacterium]MBT6222159.1 hypothetical protein [Rhodospirillaceae bacterium]MBT6364347.1 hypothetical protein [Rhodospirillaceae bacterium]